MEKRTFEFERQKFSVTLRDEADASVWAEVFKHREYRAAEEYLRACSEPVVDVGAHAGFFTIYARALNPLAPIFALEPEEKNFAGLQAHLAQNKINHVTPAPAALAGHTGTADLFLLADSHNHTLLAPKGATNEMVTVKSYTFRDFCNQFKIARVGLMKMDIEGGEYAVFEAMNDEDYAKLGAIIMEYHNYQGHKYQEIEEQLRAHGFKVQIFPSQFDKQMGFIYAVNKRIWTTKLGLSQ